MAQSPSQSKTASGKGAASEGKPESNEEMARFEDLAKGLLRVSKEDLKRELEKEKRKRNRSL
jgi:hypothetical protein